MKAESNLDIISNRRKKSLLFKDCNKSSASLDASVHHKTHKGIKLQSSLTIRSIMLPTPKSPNLFNNDTRITEVARNSELLKRNSSLPTDMENGLSTQKRRDQIADEPLASALMKVLKTDR